MSGLESRCFSVKHAGAPSIGLYFAEKIMSAFEQILSNKKYFHHLIICQILFLTKIRWKKFTCNSILIVDSEIQLLFLWDWTSSEHRDSTLGPNPGGPLGKGTVGFGRKVDYFLVSNKYSPHAIVCTVGI